jgi:hypothetical protein
MVPDDNANFGFREPPRQNPVMPRSGFDTAGTLYGVCVIFYIPCNFFCIIRKRRQYPHLFRKKTEYNGLVQ